MNQLLEIGNKAVLYFQSIPPSFWQALLASGVLSPAVKVWKHFRITKKEREIGEFAMFSIVVLGAFALSVGQYLLTTQPSNPQVILFHTAIVTFLSTPLYLGAVKPLWKYFGTKFGEAAQLEAQLHPPIPAEGLPVENDLQAAQAALHATVTEQDFSN